MPYVCTVKMAKERIVLSEIHLRTTPLVIGITHCYLPLQPGIDLSTPHMFPVSSIPFHLLITEGPEGH